jgi:hypothetical protein
MPAIPKSRPAPSSSAIVNGVTAKEKLLALLPSLTEAQAARALRASAIDAAEFDRWLASHPLDDDLEALLDATNDEMLGELAAEERRAGFGEWKL